MSNMCSTCQGLRTILRHKCYYRFIKKENKDSNRWTSLSAPVELIGNKTGNWHPICLTSNPGLRPFLGHWVTLQPSQRDLYLLWAHSTVSPREEAKRVQRNENNEKCPNEAKLLVPQKMKTKSQRDTCEGLNFIL